MDSIEEEIINEEFDGLHNREARKKLARERFFEGREAAEVRELATAVALKKLEEEKERERVRLSVQTLDGSQEKSAKEIFVENELEHVRQAVPAECLKSCVKDMVQIDVKITKYRRLLMKMVFPEMYPQEPLSIDVLSQTLSAELVSKMKAAIDKEALKHLPGEQVIPVFKFVQSFLELNRLAPAYDDMKQVKALLTNAERCVISSKEKTGCINVHLKEGEYFLDLKCNIPNSYPEHGVDVCLKEGNLPSSVQGTILQQAQEKARRLSEAPKVAQVVGGAVGREGAGSGEGSKSEKLSQNQTLSSRKMTGNLQASAAEAKKKAAELQRRLEENHVAKPSLFPVIKFLWEDCLQVLVLGKCLICQKRLIPRDPSKASKIPKGMVTFQLYCSHMYHLKCLEDYVSTPPFGKTCLVCGKKIQHAKLMTDPKALEQRWMHKEAREREIADVADFMAF